MPDLLQPLSDFEVPNLNFDAASLNDPIAEQTEWSPLVGGGNQTKTRIYKQIGPDRVAFRPDPSVVAAVVVFFLAAVGCIGFTAYSFIRSGRFSLSPLPIVGTFMAVGCGYMIHRFFPPIMFDRRAGAFWNDWKSPEKVMRKDELKAYADFDDIHALQIIREYCEERSSSSSGSSRTKRFYSYELNLVLADGARINVTDHGNQSQIREDAKRLAAFLEKPLWDATR
ncbi:hypothetical protein [Pontiella sp.]|uniref:hypothetical protein n=1 Tax=Pontiella sp. TaxID=2837462 RepID=UPI003568F8D1